MHWVYNGGVIMEILIVLGVVAYLIIGFLFVRKFAWCIGMPASSCRTTKHKLTKIVAEWSMVFFYPFWIIFMVGVLIAGK
ncbi:hypothetical protein STP4a_086 [Salmonella phage STP4-a]|uniref:Uncharacterized protein n=1 Tax=Salmonella phage STP4-a TaxID=1445860 RepID=A0A0B4L9H1_9CAUD|nr:hypothetical protein STP4a_086 [Salmonella phage STP4-a]AHJ86941.1 hypothetical protein STP4a_086 [Salmonella phage STP4-a]UFK27212.1 hypothetical protein LG358_00191 [Escherichia phage UoN_LG358_1]